MGSVTAGQCTGSGSRFQTQLCYLTRSVDGRSVMLSASTAGNRQKIATRLATASPYVSGALRPGHEYLRLIGRGGLGENSLTVRPCLFLTSPTLLCGERKVSSVSVLPSKAPKSYCCGNLKSHATAKGELQEWLEPKRTSTYVTDLVNS